MKHAATPWPSNPTSIYLREINIYVYKKIDMRVFIAPIFVITPNGKKKIQMSSNRRRDKQIVTYSYKLKNRSYTQ